MISTPFFLAFLLLPLVTSVHQAVGQVKARPTADSAGSGPWQEGVLCAPGNSSATEGTSCDIKHAVLSQTYRPLLVEGKDAPVVRFSSGSTTFLLLARYLKPREANIQFAQAFCISKGGSLAYWTTEKEYNDLAQAALQLGAKSKSKWHFYIGMVQKPGSKEPSAGWTWIHSNTAAPAQFPWAKSEPNQHNGANIQDHTEDCAVVATYHGQKAKLLVDDFPCNYADQSGKYLARGWNPQLSVACRLGASQ